MKCLRSAWPRLPTQSQRVILRGPNVSKTARKHRMWNSKTESEDQITIHWSIKPLLPTWETTPITFLQAAPADFQLSRELPAALYIFLRDLDQSRAVDTIKWRFHLVGFHQLKQDLGKSALRSRSGDEFCNLVVGSDLIHDPLETVRKNCITWANAGGRYEKVARELGGKGILMLLPEDIPRNM